MGRNLSVNPPASYFSVHISGTSAVGSVGLDPGVAHFVLHSGEKAWQGLQDMDTCLCMLPSERKP